MIRSRVRRSALLAAVATLVCGAAAPAQAAEIVVNSRCVPYLRALAPQKFVPVQGAAFSPSSNVDLAYTNGDSAGSLSTTSTGTFAPGSGVFAPSSFSPDSAGRVRSYTLTATDSVNPTVTASTRVKFVRVGAATKPARVRGNVHKRVTWRLWGARSGARIYAHWTFRGKRRATRSLGRARGPCGIVEKRAPFLAARTRYGTWKVFFTAGKKFSRKEFPFYLKQEISRTFFGAGAASVSTGSR